jgi:hypothetical protein
LVDKEGTGEEQENEIDNRGMLSFKASDTRVPRLVGFGPAGFLLASFKYSNTTAIYSKAPDFNLAPFG